MLSYLDCFSTRMSNFYTPTIIDKYILKAGSLCIGWQLRKVSSFNLLEIVCLVGYL